MKTSYKTLIEFTDHFKDEATCRQYFEQVRFRNGNYCPHCGFTKINRYADGIRYRCARCKQDFRITTKTIFGESKVPLRKWFVAIYLLSTDKKGISSIQLAKQVGVTQKTAWFMDHRIRASLKQNGGQLFGTVEADETYIGGKEKNKHANKRTPHTQGRNTLTKTPVMGLLQRKGEIKANVLEDVRMKTLEREIVNHVKIGTQMYSDDFMSYSKLAKIYPHAAVKHGKGQYVNGDVHTNSIESFWATFKRGHYGTYHYMSKKHLQKYVDEFVYRFNRRLSDFHDVFADVVNRVSNNGTMKYQALIA